MAGLRDERTRHSRDRILRAAADLIAERGYQQTSLVDVASRSGVSRGSIPWHFGDKQGLLEAVVEQLREDWEAALRARPLGHGVDGAADIARLATTAVRSRATRQMLALLFEAGDPNSPIHRSFVDIHEVFRGHIAQWARQPEISSRLPQGVDPDAVAVLVLGTVIGVNQQWSLSPRRVDLGAAYEAMTQMLLGLVGQRASTSSTTMRPGAS